MYFIGAMYAVVFGLVMLTVELKDKGKLVARAYDLVDTYLKFLTLQVCTRARLHIQMYRSVS